MKAVADVVQAAPVTDTSVRCWRCDRLLAEVVGRPWRLTCSRCKAVNKSS
jgi:phage FluMu protein Com